MVSYISLYVFAEFAFSFTHHLLLLRRIEVSNPSPTLIIIENMQPNPSSETPRLNRAVVFVHSAFRKITRKKAGKKEDQDFLNRVSAAEELRFQEFQNTYAVSEEDCDNSSDPEVPAETYDITEFFKGYDEYILSTMSHQLEVPAETDNQTESPVDERNDDSAPADK